MNRPIYLDYAATTPCCLPALEALYKCLGTKAEFGNPHSTTHEYGTNAAEVIEESNLLFAKHIGAKANEIIWTSGATEANNLAILGAAHFYQSRGKHIITLQTEHKAVLDVYRQLEREGFEVSILPVQQNGLVNLQLLKAALRPDTILVSMMLVNNELGTIQPIKDISKILKAHNIIFHTDAAQALGKISVDVTHLGVDLASFSGHKVYAPKGIGALYVRRTPRVHLKPLLFGGGQQQGLRPGTLSPALITAFAKGVQFAHQEMQAHPKRAQELRDLFLQKISHATNLKLNTDIQTAVPHIINLRFSNIEPESFLHELKNKIAIAQGSACASGTIEPSHVLRAIGLKSSDADCSFRVSFGLYTTPEDIISATQVLLNAHPDNPPQ